ncbi:hypothetical protein RUND412_011654 [Rhizina undulata]
MKTFFVSAFVLLASTLTSALPAAVAEGESKLEARQSVSVPATLNIPIYSTAPDTEFGNQGGFVYRYNGQYEITTLVAIPFTTGYPGRQCQLHFSNPSYLYQSKEAQVFTVGGDVTVNDTWNSRPYRNVQVGTFTAAYNSEATWTYIGGNTFDCPTSATTLSYEVVPVNDFDNVSWNAPNGLYIEVL